MLSSCATARKPQNSTKTHTAAKFSRLGMPKLVHLPWKPRFEVGEAALEGRDAPVANSNVPK